MDNDYFCVLKYIEIVPLENNAEQFEDLKPFEVKVCITANVFRMNERLGNTRSKHTVLAGKLC